MRKPRLLTILGTRPEIIRLSRIIPKFDLHFDHVLVHTGQNFDSLLSDVFFHELQIRKPDYFFNVNHASLAQTIAEILIKTEELIRELKPQGLFVLGDTNSAMSAIIAKRMQIPVYHWEAGNRSFDENVPEETNRKIVDHIADFNIAYSRNAFQNLVNEGISESRILVSGSPLKEVLDFYADQIDKSLILEKLKLQKNGYFVASFHRQENVDSQDRLLKIIQSLETVSKTWKLPVLVSTHPRTKIRLEKLAQINTSSLAGIHFHEPFGYFDYVQLQKNAKCVLSDSGTISEESAILKFPAVTIRNSMERQEALEAGTMFLTGLDKEQIILGIQQSLENTWSRIPFGYQVPNASDLVVELVRESINNFETITGVRKIVVS